MKVLASNFLEHPALQRMPENQKNWVGFILALNEFVPTTGDVEQVTFTNTPVAADTQRRLQELEFDGLHIHLMGRVGELYKEVEELRLQQVMKI